MEMMEEGKKSTIEEIINKNLPERMKDTNSQIQKTYQILRIVIKKRSSTGHIIAELT